MFATLRAILRTEGWQHFAASEAKGAIAFWLIVGGTYQWWNGRLLSLPTILLFFPGIFVASFAQIVPAMINAAKTVRLTEIKRGVRPQRALEMLGWTVWYLFELAFVPALAVLAMRMLDAIF
jgi:hypothetical protein